MLYHCFQYRKLKQRAHGTIIEEGLAPWGRSEKYREFYKIIHALFDDFRGHRAAGGKASNIGNTECRKILKWVILKGGLNPIEQLLDKVVNKVFNRFIHEFYDVWALIDPINPTSGAPLPSTCQKVASWVVQAWDRITEELCAKS